MKTWKRRLGIGVGGLSAVVILLLGGAYGMSASAVGAGHDVASHPFDASIGDAVEESVQNRPFTTLAMALAVGFVFGAVWRR